MNRAHLVVVLLTALIFSFSVSSATDEDTVNKSKPNIILILTDDQGYGDVGKHGNPVMKTPFMDQLHAESVRFTDFVVSPSCAPTRCALMTGMHEFKSGVTHTLSPWNTMNIESITVAEVLKSAGYTTGIFGKWHLGQGKNQRPNQRGFDQALNTVNDSQNTHFDPVMLSNGERKKFTGYREDILFSEATKFIEKNRDTPFFCYIPTYAPHGPNKVPAEYSAFYGDNQLARFFGQIANIDMNIGLLLAKLKEWKLDQNTLVVLMNDNGGTWGVDTWNAGMRGHKGTPWLGGTRALSFWCWPGTLRPRDEGHLAAHLDILPTFAEIAGAKLSDKHRQQIDGVSLLPLLKAAQADWPEDRFLFTCVARWGNEEVDAHAHNFAAVRMGKYQLVNDHFCDNEKCRYRKCLQGRQVSRGHANDLYSKKNAAFHLALTPKGKWSLFNVTEDPSASKDLADQQPERVKTMSDAYDEWWKEMSPTMYKKKKSR